MINHGVLYSFKFEYIYQPTIYLARYIFIIKVMDTYIKSFENQTYEKNLGNKNNT